MGFQVSQGIYYTPHIDGSILLFQDRLRSIIISTAATVLLLPPSTTPRITKPNFRALKLTSIPRTSLRKYYFVQISTGKSTWDKPTEAAPGAPTLSNTATPAQTTNPYQTPNEQAMSGQGNEGTRGMGDNQHGESTDRAGGLGVSSDPSCYGQ